MRCAKRLACAVTNAARALANSGARRRASFALSSRSFAVSTMVSGGHAAMVSSGAPSTGIGRRLSWSCASGGSRIRITLEYQALRPPYHAIDNRAFEQLPAGADHHPAEPGEPASVVQGAHEALDVGTVDDLEITVQSTRTGQPLAGVRPISPALVEQRMTCSVNSKIGSTDTKLGQKPPNCCILSATSGGMPLVSKSVNAYAGLSLRKWMLSAVRAIVLGWPLSLLLVTMCTLSGRSALKAPSASASSGQIFSIIAASSPTSSMRWRCADPRVITQALPSLQTLPLASSHMRLVSGPPLFLNTVISNSAFVHRSTLLLANRGGRARAGG